MFEQNFTEYEYEYFIASWGNKVFIFIFSVILNKD